MKNCILQKSTSPLEESEHTCSHIQPAKEAKKGDACSGFSAVLARPVSTNCGRSPFFCGRVQLIIRIGSAPFGRRFRCPPRRQLPTQAREGKAHARCHGCFLSRMSIGTLPRHPSSVPAYIYKTVRATRSVGTWRFGALQWGSSIRWSRLQWVTPCAS